MKRYLMFVVVDPTGETEPEADLEAWLEEGERRGIRLDGQRLRPPADARTVRLRGEEILVTDGPYTEAKEWIAGFDLLEAESLEAAVDYASRHPMARRGAIEVREFWPFDEDQEGQG